MHPYRIAILILFLGASVSNYSWFLTRYTDAAKGPIRARMAGRTGHFHTKQRAGRPRGQYALDVRAHDRNDRSRSVDIGSAQGEVAAVKCLSSLSDSSWGRCATRASDAERKGARLKRARPVR